MSNEQPATTTTTATATIGERLAELAPGGALVIPLAGLPTGTQIAITIVIGPPEPLPEPPAAPQRRYIGTRQG